MLSQCCQRRIPNLLLVVLLLVEYTVTARTVVASGGVVHVLAPENLPGVEAEVTSAFDGIPLHGFMPVHVHVKNASGRTRRFLLDADAKGSSHGSGGLQARLSIEVSCPPEAEVERDILVPIPPTLVDSHYRSGSLRNQFSGSSYVQYPHFDSRQATPQWPSIAISSKLASRTLEELKKRSEKRFTFARDFGVVVEPERLPSDWRALAGLDVLLLTHAEWTRFSVRQRVAVGDWIRLGGTLDVYAPADSVTLDELGFRAEGEKSDDGQRAFGLGRVRLFPVKNEIVDAEAVCVSVTRAVVRNWGRELFADFKGSWQLSEQMPPRTFHSPAWMGLLLVFSVLMGPVNLFLLAGKQRRHRLFVTTPIIALISSLVLGLLILVIDGTGGEGCRFVALELQPGKGGRKVYVNQQSLLATGLLIDSSFSEEHPTVHLPVALARSRWARITGSRGESANFDVSETGRFQGDWLKSRSRHGFASQVVVPSRARFELAGSEDEPALVSGLGFPTGRVFYVAMDGSFWRSANAESSTGQRVTLVPSSRSEIKQWRDKEALVCASHGLARDLRELPLRRGYFYAVADETGMELAFTDAIRWRKTSTFLFGPVVTGGEHTDPGQEEES